MALHYHFLVYDYHYVGGNDRRPRLKPYLPPILFHLIYLIGSLFISLLFATRPLYLHLSLLLQLLLTSLSLFFPYCPRPIL